MKMPIAAKYRLNGIYFSFVIEVNTTVILLGIFVILIGLYTAHLAIQHTEDEVMKLALFQVALGIASVVAGIFLS